jgi:hypothetical protein
MLHDLERRLRVAHTKGSTCNIFVHAILAACGCLEPWVCPPERWPPKPNAIRIWEPETQELWNPKLKDLLPGDLIVYRVNMLTTHIEIYLGPNSKLKGYINVATGGQPGGRYRHRSWSKRTPVDVAVPLDKLAWSHTAPTVGQWLERVGLPLQPYSVAEKFINPDLLARADAAR